MTRLIGRSLAVLSIVILALGILSSLGIFGTQCLLWLKNGYWTVSSFQTEFGPIHPNTDWVGINSIIDWYLRLPLALAILGAAISGWIIIFQISEVFEREGIEEEKREAGKNQGN